MEGHVSSGTVQSRMDRPCWISTSKAYFISPIVDMEKLIIDMMLYANVPEEELKERGMIRTDFGEDLSWEYLCYIREHPIKWVAPTSSLYGSNDNLTSPETVRTFAKQHNADLTMMENGEHWFHTDEQMRFLDDWIRRKEKEWIQNCLHRRSSNF